jgi:putative peptidoglycan lipid II flippase
MTLLRSVLTVGGLTAASRVAGFARDMLVATVLGAGPMADAFVIALKLPNLMRRLVAEGAFTVTFVPLVAAELARLRRREAMDFAGETLALMIAVLLPATIAAMLFMPALLRIVAPGFDPGGARAALAIDYARLACPYLLLMAVAAVLGGMLNASGRLAPFAAAPILFNLVLIAALLFGGGLGPTPGHALAAGVTASGAVQLVWLALFCRRAGIRVGLPRPRLTAATRRLLRLLGPGTVGAGIGQLTLFLGVLLASFLPPGAVSHLYYADRLTQLPLGVVGIALGTALLPRLAQLAAAGGAVEAARLGARAAYSGMTLALPAAIGLALLAEPMVALLFQRGAFGPADTAAVAGAVAGFALGIPAYILVKVMATACFARSDTTTPVLGGLAAAAVTVLGSLALLGSLGHVGIALATSIATWADAAVLAAILARRGELRPSRAAVARWGRLALANAGLAAAVLAEAAALAAWPPVSTAAAAMALSGIVLAAACLYGALCRLLGVVTAQEWRRLLPVDRLLSARR